MNTCNTCKYWNVHYNIMISGLNSVSDCDKVKRMPDKCMTFEIDATATDNSGLEYTLLTSGNFGCVLHELKNP